MAGVDASSLDTLLDRVGRWYREKPDAPAITLITPHDETVLSYRTLLTEAARYTAAFTAQGVRAGDIVALVLQHGESVLYGFWGALLLGAVPTLLPFLTEKLDPDRYFASVRALVEVAGVRVVVTYDALAPRLEDALRDVRSSPAIVSIEQVQPGEDVPAYLAASPARGEDTAFLQHSSGSTGLQKGVMLSHRAVLNHIESLTTVLDLRADDVIVSWLPLYHDMGLIAGFILPLVAGIPLVLMSPFDWIRNPGMLLQAVDRYRGTLCWLPNFAYNFLATRLRSHDVDGLDLSSWRAIINTSEPVRAESNRMFLERFASYGVRETALACCYGMAENVFAATQTTPGQPPRLDTVDRELLLVGQRAVPADGSTPTLTFVSCGKPIPGCTLRVVDATGAPLPERQVGEIILRSNSMLTGYYNRPEATAEVLIDGWYYSGDMGYLADGELYVTGRKKDLIIIGGKNIYPQDVENLLNDIPGIHPGRVVAFGVDNPRLGTEDLSVVVEVDTDDVDQRAAIMREIRARVTGTLDVVARNVYLVPREWLIKTSSGKIARRANREKYLAESGAAADLPGGEGADGA